MTLLCIGDSNTNGYDPRSFLGDSYPDGIRWADRLYGYDVINWGINGITIPYDASVYVDLIRRKEPDIVIVMLGTNDILQGASAEQTSRRMESFIDTVASASKPILLIAPPKLSYGEDVQDKALIDESGKLGKLYRDIASRQGCRYEDAGEWNIDLAFDGVHFSEDGHKTFAENLERVLANL